MSTDHRNHGRSGAPPAEHEDDQPYRVYRAGRPERPASPTRPYTLYRAGPRGLRDRLGGASQAGPADPDAPGRQRPGRRGGGSGGPDDPADPRRRFRGRPITPWRVVRWVVAIIVAWVVLSVVLFFVSAQTRSGNLPSGAKAQLAGGSTMLASPETVLILGLDNRPRSGTGSREGGLTASQFSERDANTDTIMLWRVGGGVSRRLSIPRDTLVNIPGCGEQKINAAWSCAGPGATLQAIKRLTGIRTINHLVIVDLGNFPKFINDIGGVNVKTGRICSNISGGRANGGFTLNLRPGTHHLDGEQALVLARTRENSCDLAYDDLNREAAQQRIVNSIKSQLVSAHTFFHLPWAAWDAPGVVQTDMGGLSMLQLFLSSEIGGSAPSRLLKESGSTYDGEDVLIPSTGNVHREVRILMTGHA